MHLLSDSQTETLLGLGKEIRAKNALKGKDLLRKIVESQLLFISKFLQNKFSRSTWFS